MASRTGAKPYRVRIKGLQHPQQVPPMFFRRFVALGWIVTTGARFAELRSGVTGWLEDGKLRLQDCKAGMTVSIPCSWAWVERAALYSDRGPKVGTLEYERLIQQHHCER
jgi:hypothetical protein